MATITRCDKCKKLSDDERAGYIGKDHEVRHYRDLILTIRTEKDMCADCVKKAVAEGNLQQRNKPEFD